MYTQNTSKLWVDENFFSFLASTQCDLRIKKLAEQLNEYIKVVYQEIENLPMWAALKNTDIYYIDKYQVLIPDITGFDCSVVNENSFNTKFDKFSGRLIKEHEAFDLFFVNRSNNPFYVDDIWFTSGQTNRCVVRYLCKDEDAFECMNSQGNRSCCYKNRDNNCHKCSWGYGIKIPVYDLSDKPILENFIIYDIIPSVFSDTSISVMNILSGLYKSGYIVFYENSVAFTQKLNDDVQSGKIEEILGISFKKSEFENDMKEYSKNKAIDLKAEHIGKYIDNILNCDKIRAGIESYDKKRLTDPNEGMWDLWGDEGCYGENKIQIDTNFNFIGRNPLADVKEDGIVGIDFGTKSTIVVYQNGNDTIMPMRIGLGEMSAVITPEQYENPTVMEIKNLENFLRCYKSRDGRPLTEWSDITVSHTAFGNMVSSTISDNFYSYFYDLKQWCADFEKNNNIVTIKDQCENEYELEPYLSGKRNVFDPIEIYAYYLGLYINNIRNGVYLDYVLSFPITYHKDLREKIRNSFENGIRKSLPQTVLEDKRCMDAFCVSNGVSEPVAYAITAFTEFGLKPDENQEYLYGVFDFGGGTTDFSFGTYKRADISEKKKYDYIITYVSYGGDRYLGGENLLELMAYRVFRENYKKLLRRTDGKNNFKGIEFTCPPECETFLGSETLISNSRKAKRNMKQLAERLRLYWENIGKNDTEPDTQTYELISQVKKGFVRVDLFDNDGNLLPDFELDLYNEQSGININLDDIIEKRIERGVRQFFSALAESFSENKLTQAGGIEIFLAGNSGKSPILRKLFDKYSKSFYELSPTSNITGDEFFHIYPSLGTEEAVSIQKENGIDAVAGELYGPTGKTGVAYGIIKGRIGSRIKVVSQVEDEDEPLFCFHLGHCEDECFVCDINRKQVKNQWIEFSPADASRIEIYYTDMSEALKNNVPINLVSKKIIRVKNVDEKASIFIRAVSQTVAEYVIAYREQLGKEIYLSEKMKLDF